MQSLRDTVHRIPHPRLSSSRISLNTEKNRPMHMSIGSAMNDGDVVSLKVPSISSRTSMYIVYQCIRRGLVVRISAFHAGGPGSIPGVGIPFFLPFSFTCLFVFTKSIDSLLSRNVFYG